MPNKLEKPGGPERIEVLELDDAMLDLAVGGLNADLLTELNIILTNTDCPCSPTTTKPSVSCGG